MKDDPKLNSHLASCMNHYAFRMKIENWEMVLEGLALGYLNPKECSACASYVEAYSSQNNLAQEVF